MKNSDIELIKKSLLFIEKENFTSTDIAEVIHLNFKHELTKENKNTNYDSIKSRVRRVLRDNFNEFDLKVIGKDEKNGAKIYEKDDFDFFDFDDDLEEEEKDNLNKKQLIIRKLLNEVSYLKNLEHENIGMASDAAIIFWVYNLLNDYLQEKYESSYIEETMQELLNLISSSLTFSEAIILQNLKSKNIRNSEYFNFSISDDILNIENQILKELRNDK